HSISPRARRAHGRRGTAHLRTPPRLPESGGARTWLASPAGRLAHNASRATARLRPESWRLLPGRASLAGRTLVCYEAFLEWVGCSRKNYLCAHRRGEGPRGPAPPPKSRLCP